MNKIISGIALLLCLSVFKAQNGAVMEYKISSTKGATGSVAVKFSEFGSLSVFQMNIPQMPGGGMTYKSLTMKNKPGVTYRIDDVNKAYSEVLSTDPAAMDDKTYVVKKLGEEKINGYNCAHATITSGKETEEVWNTKDIKEYAKYSEAYATDKKLGSRKREQALKDAGCDGIPVKTLHKGDPKEGDMTMELVKMERKNLPKSDFEIPEGYTARAGSGPAGPPGGPAGMKSQQELMNMTPEERAKYAEEMRKKYGEKK